MKLNAKCVKCGGDDWKHDKRQHVVCAVCNPRIHGRNCPWPRTVHPQKRNNGAVQGVMISDNERMKVGMTFLIHRESWGYRVVLSRKGKAKR